ncbi:hypothetical protein [Dyadobacter sp. CY261]|uniref:hypothetical protein n=1 Tax=Dyadobacter sp. CY261 TaxID=2907203 RepID=UPI0038D4F494
MFTNSFSVLFYLKRRSNYVSGDLPIYLRITASGHRIELATKRTCEPEKWNSAAGRKSGTKENTRSDQKCGHNTTMRYIAYCKKIVLSLIKLGLLQKDPFFGFKIRRKEVNRAALTERELKTIGSKKFPSARLTQVRDIFLFSCYTCLLYGIFP